MKYKIETKDISRCPNHSTAAKPLFDPYTSFSDFGATSGCEGGTAYKCSDASPWAVDNNLVYGFAATNIAGESG
ncbi:Endoglucanase-5 [Lachnellula suecica]|uniref:cellulase n=1 Tax=Lachnellula suecica TaxID=602035 RepID=A0A8T9BVQ5_9HELO|nr:Endoglucanase-5 [Lachnellula suecica]